MDKNFKEGRRVKCIRQPNEITAVNLVGLPGRIIYLVGNIGCRVDFGIAGQGDWFMLNNEINLIQRRKVCQKNKKKKTVPVSS